LASVSKVLRAIHAIFFNTQAAKTETQRATVTSTSDAAGSSQAAVGAALLRSANALRRSAAGSLPSGLRPRRGLSQQPRQPDVRELLFCMQKSVFRGLHLVFRSVCALFSISTSNLISILLVSSNLYN